MKEKLEKWVEREYGGWVELFFSIAVVIFLSCILGYLISLAF